MGWKFFGYACVYGVPDREGDLFAHHCFYDYVRAPGHLDIPMLDGHEGESIGRWRRMVETAYGLLVWGELTVEGDLNTPPGYPPAGLSVATRDVQGPNIFTAWGGRIARSAGLKEISIVAEPSNHGARILGEWSDF
jgi:hypothetical protein